MLTILDLITSTLNFVLGIAFISNFYPFRDKLKVRIPICAAILIARSVLSVYAVYHLYYLKVILYVIPFIACTIILLKCDKFRFLLLDALCIAILYLTEIIGGLIIIIPRHISMFELVESDELRTPLFFICMFIVVVLYGILGVIVKCKKKRKSYDNRYMTPYEVISFAMLVALEMLTICGLARVFPNEQLNTFLVIFSVGFCILDFGLYYLFILLSDARRIEQENQLMKQQSEMQLQAYQGLSEQYNESLRIVHDMRKHIRSLDTLIENGSDKAADYQQTLFDELNRFYPNFQNDNQMLAVIVNNEIDKAKRLGIEIRLNIEKISLDFISPIDMTTIFSNLLDNAIEACAEVDDKVIKFSIVQQMNFITINIRNPYNRIDQQGDTLRSTKEGHFGIGLENVRKALERYDGRLNIKTNDGIFAVTVIIPIPE